MAQHPRRQPSSFCILMNMLRRGAIRVVNTFKSKDKLAAASKVNKAGHDLFLQDIYGHSHDLFNGLTRSLQLIQSQQIIYSVLKVLRLSCSKRVEGKQISQ
jgi:hypothetical protein